MSNTAPLAPGAETKWSSFEDPMHAWFGLSYSNFLVLHRSILQSMPAEWQARFAALVDEIPETLEVPEGPPGGYKLTALDDRGRFMRDPVPHYNRGRTRIPLKAVPRG